MSSTQFWTGMVVPPFLKWINPYLKKFFKLKEIDSETKTRVSVRQYPAYFGLLYGLWMIALFSTGFITLLWFIISGQIFLGLINMVGGWLIGGAIFNFLFWQISTSNFRDYVKSKLIKSGWEYEVKDQITTLFKIGVIYYLVVSPLIIYLYFW